jgi:hypothetical protein
MSKINKDKDIERDRESNVKENYLENFTTKKNIMEYTKKEKLLAKMHKNGD